MTSEKTENKAIHILQTAKRSGIVISVDNSQLSIKYSKGVNIEPNLLEEIKNNKDLIIDFLNHKKSKLKKLTESKNQIRQIVKDPTEHIPPSFSQERLWFIDQLEGSIQYHSTEVWRSNSVLNKEALSYALQTLIDRHEVLRTVFLEQEGKVYQTIMDTKNWQLEIIDGSMYTQNRQGLKKDIQNLIRQPFDLSKDYMIRAHLITLCDQEQILIVTTHHIATDGWSFSILVKEVVELYNQNIV